MAAYAFFDVDGTLIRTKSMFGFHDHWHRHWLPQTPETQRDYDDISAILRALDRRGSSREIINRRYYEFFAGRDIGRISECARAWYDSVRDTPDFFIDESVEKLNALRTEGYEPVLVSGSFVELLKPIAETLNVQHILATRMVLNGSRCTGKIHSPQTIGEGKAEAIRLFLGEQNIDAATCWAYGDDHSDLPMLEAVGNAGIVEGDPRLEAIASTRSWPMIRVSKTAERTAASV